MNYFMVTVPPWAVPPAGGGSAAEKYGKILAGGSVRCGGRLRAAAGPAVWEVLLSLFGAAQVSPS